MMKTFSRKNVAVLIIALPLLGALLGLAFGSSRHYESRRLLASWESQKIPELRSIMKPLALSWSTNAEPFQARWGRQLLDWMKKGESENR
ncbi:MAG: hypothetical protein HY735_01115 [Verrucomicrobia bacterium]|nr:hypothetical protein [Verrucomicrobiota bacterium]